MMDWPESEELNNLKKSVFKKLGRELVLRDAEEHESGEDLIARYESASSTIYCRNGDPSYATLFAIAHELGHAWQEAIGIKRFRLRNEFRYALDLYQDQPTKDHIRHFHHLSNTLNNLILDRGADYFAECGGLYTREAIEYFLVGVDIWHRCSKEYAAAEFNPDEFRRKAKIFSDAIMLKKDYEEFQLECITLICAAHFANRWLRLNEFKLVSSNTALFDKYFKPIQQVGSVLIDMIANTVRDFNSVEQCRNAETALAKYLGLDPIFEIRA